VKLGELKVVGNLGAGSQGSVQKTIHTPTGIIMALKARIT